MSASKKTAKSTVAEKKDAAKKRGLSTDTDGNVNKIIAIEAAQKENRSVGEKIAEWVAAFCGSMLFVYVHIIWFGTWIVINSFTDKFRFDPFPYTFLTLVVSLEAIFLSTFILISQNHETILTERRNHLDLQINMLAEQENTKLLEMVRAIAEKVGVACDDEAMDALLEPMDPEKVVQQILEATGEDPKEADSKKAGIK